MSVFDDLFPFSDTLAYMDVLNRFEEHSAAVKVARALIDDLWERCEQGNPEALTLASKIMSKLHDSRLADTDAAEALRQLIKKGMGDDETD